MRKLPAIILVLLAAGGPATAGEGPPSGILVEFGRAMPLGDLADDFIAAPLGFGAEPGLEAGFRWRVHLSDGFSLAPAFHFTDYGNFSGTDADLGEYRLECSTYQYTLEAMLHTADPAATLRPFVAVAAGLYRNRSVGFTKTFERSFDESVNTFGGSLRAGLAVAEIELSVVYHLDRFSTWRFFRTGTEQAYSWDALVLRAAWAIPFGDG